MQSRNRFARFGLWLLFIALGLLAALGPTAVSQENGQDSEGLALVVTIDGGIGPAQAAYLREGLEEAEARGADLVILQLDTPGGLVTTTREMVRDILAAPVPVVGYVAPRGARAASAGTYLIYATHLAAMAPGTTIGAATPVAMGLELPGRADTAEENGTNSEENGAADDEPDAAERKALEDAVAWIRSLAELRGRNADWAEAAVREAATLTGSQAVEENVVEVTAASIPELLAAIDGREVEIGDESRTLSTEAMAAEDFEANWRITLLSIIADPNIAFILMMIGIYGIIFELANPGAAIPGVIGVISLLLGLYALNLLPVNYAGLALMLIGLAFMIAEAFLPSFGMLGIGGAIAFALGGAFLFDIDDPAFDLSLWTLGSVTALTAGLMILLLGYVWRSQRHRVTTGEGWFARTPGAVVSWQDGEGTVDLRGEQWHARAAQPLSSGQRVRVIGRQGLVLTVEPLDSSANPGPDSTVSETTSDPESR